MASLPSFITATPVPDVVSSEEMMNNPVVQLHGDVLHRFSGTHNISITNAHCAHSELSFDKKERIKIWFYTNPRVFQIVELATKTTFVNGKEFWWPTMLWVRRLRHTRNHQQQLIAEMDKRLLERQQKRSS